MGKIVVTSDQHLGYEHSNVSEFRDFLGYILTRDDVESLILLGDIIDMWRRDVSGLFLCFSDIIKKLLELRESKKIEIYVIAGNHDFHLLRLIGPDYKFKFYQELSTSGTAMTTAMAGDKKYVFKHGWEFDLAQHPLIMEAMCHNMSDSAGHARSSIYNILQIAKDEFGKDLKDIIEFHNKNDGYVQNLMLPPQERLKPYLGDVERKAYTSIEAGQTLIFGHTHRPFISSDNTILNTGSWVSDAEYHNTFAELDETEMRLYQFEDKENVKDLTEQLRTSMS
jgi:UDP-2,3-diacylglucosamine pyrophosphatase LpxH